MEGAGGEQINVECKTVNEFKVELTEAYKTIVEAAVKSALEEKTVEILREENAALKKRIQSEGSADDRETEVKREIVERKAEEIIPKECWALVFRKLDEKDWLGCRLVCKTFKELLDLKEFKMKWKFKVILPLLFPYLRASYSDGKPWKHLHNPRLVCRSWRRDIDKYASEVHGRESFSPYHLPLLTRFRTSEDIQGFQQAFGECTGNPFPSSSVEIGNPNEVDEELVGVEWLNAMLQLHDTYFGNVGQLLEQFGKHIFKLRLQFEYYALHDPYPMTICQLIKSITIHLPNLRELSIHCLCDEDFEEDEEDAERVTAYIAENALEASALPKLRVLTISGLDFDRKMEDYLLDAFAPQLTHFKTPFPQDSLQQFKNLRKLLLDVDEPSETLESFRFLQSPLEFLNLNCTFRTSHQTWNVDKVLRNLKHLPIELLEIRLSAWDEDRVNLAEAGLDIEEYNNESIKTLAIHIDRPGTDGNQISYNFLQALTKLENLKLKFSTRQFRQRPHPITHPGELPEVVKLNEYLFGEGETDIYQSNVWEKVPSLKTLTSSILSPSNENQVDNKSIFTREEYEKTRIIAEDDPERN